jgi:hypothetical protein
MRRPLLLFRSYALKEDWFGMPNTPRVGLKDYVSLSQHVSFQKLAQRIFNLTDQISKTATDTRRTTSKFIHMEM